MHDSTQRMGELTLRQALTTHAVANGGYTETLANAWAAYNVAHFDSALTPASIRLKEPSAPPLLGQYEPRSGDALRSVIVSMCLPKGGPALPFQGSD